MTVYIQTKIINKKHTSRPITLQDLLVMVQKSGVHQLRLVVEIPLFAMGFSFSTIQTVVVFRISEPSTVGIILMTDPWKNGMSVCLPIRECFFSATLR